jgi:hypothetical protein
MRAEFAGCKEERGLCEPALCRRGRGWVGMRTIGS